jgi:hypothetical protein
MVRGMWYNPSLKRFGCDGHSKCFIKCLKGKGSASKNSPNCGAFYPVPSWALEFRCPRFIYRKQPDGKWLCVYDDLGILAPAKMEVTEDV